MFHTWCLFVCKVEDETVLKAADDVEEAMWLPLSEVHTEQFGLRSIRQALLWFPANGVEKLKKVEILPII